jgi:hypothetical protein
MKRVILKKTTYFNKNHKGLSKRITRYLEKYVDEVGKASQKRGERLGKIPPTSTEQRWLLPVEKTGVFYTGGFLGEETSPGSAEMNKQKGWIRRFTTRYVRSLEKSPKRRSDGFRFVMSMAPEAVANLTKANISCDQAMREIWRTTMELYKERHGWNNPQDDVAWIAGAHHDTDNAHLHVLLFPTTKSGKLLRTNNARGPQRIDDLNELVAMANIATEIFWRELLPLNLQSPQFIEALAINPEQEPPLPTLESFRIRSGIPGKRREEPEEPAKPMILLDSRYEEDQALEYGEISILSKIKKKLGLVRGRIQLRATVSVALKWANKKLKFFGILKTLNNNEDCSKIRLALKKEFPKEVREVESLSNIQETISNKKTKKELNIMLSDDMAYTGAVLARISGDLNPEDVKDQQVLEWSGKLANVFENATSDTDTQTKLSAVYKEGKSAQEQKTQEERRTLIYRRVKRAAEKALKLNPSLANILDPAINCINKIIRGSKRITLVLEARANEAKSSVKTDENGKASIRKEKREWILEKTENGFEFVVKENEGKPYPPHFDPDTVIEPLKDLILKGEADLKKEIEIPRVKRGKTEELTDIDQPIYKTGKEDEEESPLELLLRLRGRKNLYRKKEAIETIKRHRLRYNDVSSSSDAQGPSESEEPDFNSPSDL